MANECTPMCRGLHTHKEEKEEATCHRMTEEGQVEKEEGQILIQIDALLVIAT